MQSRGGERLTPKERDKIKHLMKTTDMSVAMIAERFGVVRSTLFDIRQEVVAEILQEGVTDEFRAKRLIKTH